jgi:hypothetical protein
MRGRAGIGYLSETPPESVIVERDLRGSFRLQFLWGERNIVPTPASYSLSICHPTDSTEPTRHTNPKERHAYAPDGWRGTPG